MAERFLISCGTNDQLRHKRSGLERGNHRADQTSNASMPNTIGTNQDRK
jgi:hypothetical protein